jgi:hypothetical protein
MVQFQPDTSQLSLFLNVLWEWGDPRGLAMDWVERFFMGMVAIGMIFLFAASWIIGG